ncbi:MAG: RDD family protein [Pseudomonadota bacterium]
MSEPVLASPLRRLVALTIDLIVVCAVGFWLVLVTGVVHDPEDYVNMGMTLFNGLLCALGSYVLVNGGLLIWRGQTLGKLLLSIRAVAVNGEPLPAWKHFLIRMPFFFMTYTAATLIFLPFVLIDYLLVARENRRTLHDLMSGAIVVDLE